VSDCRVRAKGLEVFAVAALACADGPVVLDQVERSNPFDHLAAERGPHLSCKGPPTIQREWDSIHLVGQDGLGMRRFLNGAVEEEPDVTGRRYPAGPSDVGLCQPPDAAMSASAALGPHVPRR
jgi:hypothetical protein